MSQGQSTFTFIEWETSWVIKQLEHIFEIGYYTFLLLHQFDYKAIKAIYYNSCFSMYP